MIPILTRTASGTHHAQTLTPQGKAKLKTSSTESERGAARSLAEQYYGQAAAETLEPAPSDDHESLGVADYIARARAVYRVWTIDDRARHQVAATDAEIVGPGSEIELCNTLHAAAGNHAEAARRSAEIACHYAVLLGVRLQRLKAETPHGGWEGLFPLKPNRAQEGKRARFDFSVDTAKRYIRAAEGALARPGLPAAARKRIEAAAEGEAAELDPDLHADLDRATRGETLRQLYLDLGVIRGSAAERGGGGGAGKASDPPPQKDPETSLADEVYQSLARRFHYLTQCVSLGELAHLRPEQLTEVEDTLRGYLDEIRKINRS